MRCLSVESWSNSNFSELTTSMVVPIIMHVTSVPSQGPFNTYKMRNRWSLKLCLRVAENSSVRLLNRRLRGIQCETEASFWVIPEGIRWSRRILPIVAVECGAQFILVRAFCVVFVRLLG